MRMRITGFRSCVLAITLPALAAVVSGAQSRRDPTADEAKVLARFFGAIASVTAGFADDNWQVSGGTLPDDPSHETIAAHARVPLDDCFGGDRTWTVREDSERYNSRVKPLYDRVKALADGLVAKYQSGQTASGDKQEIDRVRQQIKNTSEVTMDVCANSPNVEATALTPNAPSLLPGVAAHKVSADVCGGGTTPCYVLAFGDWKSARASNGRYDFHFVHPAGSPYLENVVIRLQGADDRIQEMLKADWGRVSAALGGA
jgi:hypothetical protein